jgi:hypothetical protein
MEVKMKKLMVITLFLLLLVFPNFSSDRLTKEFKVQDGQELEVNLKSGGSIAIEGWNKKKVKVEVIFRSGDRDDWDIEFTQTRKGIEIESDYWNNGKRSPRFYISVPQRFNLELKTMGGNISLENVQGKIKGKTMGGSLDLRDLKGELEMTTMGGKITLKDSDVDGSVKTMGGRVLLENVVGNIKGSSMGGNVVYKNVKSRKGESTGKVVKISTMGGSINVDEAPYGADVHTMGGKIRIKSAKKFIKAKTMGGDIDVDSIDGEIKATTYGGDIEVNMTGNPQKGKRDVELRSLGGDITLYVPSGLSMKVDIEIGYTKYTHREFKIYSDFDIKVEKSKTWDRKKGTPRKYLYGKGTIAGGKNLIKIKTINGNVYLKKR